MDRSWSLPLLSLFQLAVAHPLYDLLSRNVEFFVVRHSEKIDIVLIVLFLSAFLPGLVVVVSHFFRWIGVLGITVLITCLVLPGMKTLPLSGWVIVVLTALMAFGTVSGALRYPRVHHFLLYLSPAIVVVPILFLFQPAVRHLLFSKDPVVPAVEIRSRTPVFLIVFDELPLISLLDTQGKIDESRYPNFAHLAKDGLWIPNATTVSTGTPTALGAILTGCYPVHDLPPTLANYPRNIFTFFGSDYRLRAWESGSSLSPKQMYRLSVLQQLRSTVSDLAAIFLQRILPEDLARSFPSVTQLWGGFWNQGSTGSADDNSPPRLFERFVESIENSPEPTFYFIHVMLPHVPWKYLPSGKQYQYGSSGYFGIEGLNRFEKWVDDESVVVRGYQRHLLQVRFTDSLLGRFLERLKFLNLYDNAIIVVTADHGASFAAGQYRRGWTLSNSAEVLLVPLILKLPHGKSIPTNPREAQIIDIFPTIADAVNTPIPWKVEGKSLLRNSRNLLKKVFLGDRLQNVLPGQLDWTGALQRKIALFGEEPNCCEFPESSSYHELLNKDVMEVSSYLHLEPGTILRDDDLYRQVDLNSDFIPVLIQGTLNADRTPRQLAVAVNGKIAAVTRSYFWNRIHYFSAMVPETSFRQGFNQITIYRVNPHGGQVSR